MVDTKVILSGLELSNPIIPASGTFGFGYKEVDKALGISLELYT